MSLRIGSRIFAPSPWLTVVTLVLLVLLVALGHWQLRRADEKQRLDDAFAAGGGPALSVDGATAALPRYQHIEAHGHFDPDRQVLIDNMVSAGGRVGYYVMTPFELDGGGWLLINRGWVALGASRQARPAIAVGAGERVVHGRADHLPVAGIHLGTPAPLAPPFPVVASFPTQDELAALLNIGHWSPATQAVLLDREEPDGYLRAWAAPGMAPLRHTAYALQWFGLALTLAVIYLVTNLRKA